jgi:hypothetical protein
MAADLSAAWPVVWPTELTRVCCATRGLSRIYAERSPTCRSIVVYAEHWCGAWARARISEARIAETSVPGWPTLGDAAALQCDDCGATDLDTAWRHIADLIETPLDDDLRALVDRLTGQLHEDAPESVLALRTVLVEAVHEQHERQWERAASGGTSP